MPESTDPVPQPSFTSSTYRAIAENGSLVPTSDRPLADQPEIQTFLGAVPEEPVSESLLYRLLTVVELYLEQSFPEKQLGGLCLGYSLKTDESSHIYYVSWGWIPDYEIKLDRIRANTNGIVDLAEAFETQLHKKEELLRSNSSSAENTQPDEDLQLNENVELEKITRLIEQEILNRLSHPLPSGQRLRTFVITHFSPATREYQDIFSEFAIDRFNQFSVPIDSRTDLVFDSDNLAVIPLNRNVQLNPEVILNVNRENFSFGLTRLQVSSAQACHVHRDSNNKIIGNFKYRNSSTDHGQCDIC